MPLVDHQIRERIKPRMFCPTRQRDTFTEGISGPGVISYGLSSCGYDFRLAETVKAFTSVHSVKINPKRIDPARTFAQLTPSERRESYHSPKHGGGFERDEKVVVIPARGYVLAETVEYLHVPDDVVVIVIGKSTYARSGIIVNCTPLEPGWKGITTLEIGNLNDSPAELYVGEGIAQALFFPLAEVPRMLYGARSGRYQDQPGLTLPTVV